MNQSLPSREKKPRGSFLFPFECYAAKDPDGSFYVSPHWHPEVEILCLYQGAMELTIDDRSFCPPEGSVIFIGPESIHYLNSLGPGLFYHAFVFPLEMLSFGYEDYCQQSWILPLIQKKAAFPQILEPGAGAHQEVFSCLKRLSLLHQNQEAGYQLMTKALLYQVLAVLVREKALLAAPAQPTAARKKKMETLRQILSYIDDHLQEKLTLEQIASHFYMSSHYFCRFFKENLGKTPTGYINSLRLERACALLSHSDLSVLEVSLSCGFNNLSYFIRLFHRQKGMPPSQYRRESQLRGLGN